MRGRTYRVSIPYIDAERRAVSSPDCECPSDDAVRVTIGNKGSANPHIEQHAWVLQRDAEKWPWLESHLVEFSARGRLLVFVNSKEGAEELAKSISNWFSQRFLANSTPQSSYSEKGTIVASAAPTPSTSQRALALHGDKDQEDREKIVAAFKKGNAQVGSLHVDLSSVSRVRHLAHMSRF